MHGCVHIGVKTCLAQGVDDHAVAVIGEIIAVDTDAVDADDIGLVFDGPGRQQRFPVGGPPGGPARYIDRSIILAAIARPDREAQIETDERRDAPAL